VGNLSAEAYPGRLSEEEQEMNEKPSLLIEFDPLTWQINAIYFKASTDEETKRLTEILVRGVKYQIPVGGHYDA